MNRPGQAPFPGGSLRALAWAYLALVIYATWFPFAGWRWPAGVTLEEVLSLPWPRWNGWFDDWANLLGYAGLGALWALALASRRRVPWVVALGLVFLLSLLSYVLECGQHLLPGRVSSLRDWALNSLGAALGVAFIAVMRRSAQPLRSASWVDQWWSPGAGAGPALVFLWPMALMIPTPLPLGLGQWFRAWQSAMEDWTSGVAWAETFAPWWAMEPATRLGPLSETLAVALGVLGPMCLVLAMVRPGWRAIVSAALVAMVAGVATSLTTGLQFGAGHALGWLTPQASIGWILGGLAGLAVAIWWPTGAALLGLMVFPAHLVLVAQSPADPYLSATLQRWDQGPHIRFQGAAIWLGWAWPYLAMGWLMARLGRRPGP